MALLVYLISTDHVPRSTARASATAAASAAFAGATAAASAAAHLSSDQLTVAPRDLGLPGAADLPLPAIDRMPLSGVAAVAPIVDVPVPDLAVLRC
ncbi:hypothetical protein [Dactylosporangium sp. CS-033363]|uniref:hypothetical protein n=1 Tax=Dactylosporangium sp. CS-033363 TaxID=3239935 RepID=UPI003D8FEBCF